MIYSLKWQTSKYTCLPNEKNFRGKVFMVDFIYSTIYVLVIIFSLVYSRVVCIRHVTRQTPHRDLAMSV